MPNQTQHPLAGDPPTFETKDKGGLPCYAIKPREMTPSGVKAADQITWLFSLAFAGWLIWSLLTLPNPHIPDWLIAGAAWFAARSIVRRVLLETFKVTTVVVMTTDGIKVRHWLRWRPYDRNLEHRFALAIHDQAKQEQQDNEFEIRKAGAKGSVIRKPVYYGESFHVVMVYEGHRIDLLTVYGQRRAESVMARLQYCDRRLNEAAKQHGGNQNPHADNDWYETPGGLNNE